MSSMPFAAIPSYGGQLPYDQEINTRSSSETSAVTNIVDRIGRPTMPCVHVHSFISIWRVSTGSPPSEEYGRPPMELQTGPSGLIAPQSVLQQPGSMYRWYSSGPISQSILWDLNRGGKGHKSARNIISQSQLRIKLWATCHQRL
jgi:hypothetical protein